MTEKEILDFLETILHKPEYNPGSNVMRFYVPKTDKEGYTFYTFSNKTVERLLVLSQRLISEEERILFWETLSPSAITPLFSPLFQKSNNSQVRRDAFANQDFILMLFAKSNKLHEILDIVFKNVAICPPRNRFFYALIESLKFDPKMFNKSHLDKILLVIKEYCGFK